MAYGTNVIQIWGAETILASANVESQSFALDWYHLQGFFSLHIQLSDDGAGDFQYGIGNDKATWLYSSDPGDDIVTGMVKTDGPGTDGNQIYSFDPPVSGYIKFKVTETGGADPIVVSAWLAMA
jgi:hypothetical protein